MKFRLIKKLSIGVAALALVVPLALTNNNLTNVNARHRHYRYTRRARYSRSLSYYQAKKAVRRAFNHRDKDGDIFSLHNDGRTRSAVYLKASFGANAGIYFRVTKSGRHVHIHDWIKAMPGAANEPGYNYVSRGYYRMYGIKRNANVRL